MTLGWIVKGYPYSFQTRAPLTTDNSFSVPYIWINTVTDTAYMLNAISDGIATWVVKEPDSILDSGTTGLVKIIGESYLGTITRAPGGGYALPPNVVVSNPGSGEHKVESIKIESGGNVSIRYESATQP
jgi:hypothetical protein